MVESLPYCIVCMLTHNMAMIQPLFPSSKWNKGEIFGLKFPISYVDTPQKDIEIPPGRKKVIFCTEFVILGKTPSFYEVYEWVRKWVPA